MIKKYFLFIISIIVCSLGDSLLYKANIGVNPVEAISLSLSYIFQVEVGTMTIIFYSVLIIIQILMQKKLNLRTLLQIPLSLFIGVMINFWVYDILAGLKISPYITNFSLAVLGLTISAIGVGMLVFLDLVTFPVEGISMKISLLLNVNFQKIRQLFDISSVVISIALTLMFQLDFAVREGTVIGAIIFSPIMAFSMRKLYS